MVDGENPLREIDTIKNKMKTEPKKKKRWLTPVTPFKEAREYHILNTSLCYVVRTMFGERSQED